MEHVRPDDLDPIGLARRLIRFDTTNPPGREGECVAFVDGLLRAAGLETRVLERTAGRPNLVARLPGRGVAPGLVLHAHVDVVPVDGQPWTREPFAGEVVDGELWGRGAIDMKGPLACMLSAVLRLAAAGTPPAGDVVLAVVADEEAGSADGAGFLVREHAGLFAGAAYAVGEDGGAGVALDGSVRLHPVVVAEKRAVWLRATLRGPAGHASRVTPPESAPRLLNRLLGAFDGGGLGPRRTEAGDRMLTGLAAAAPEPLAGGLRRFRDDPADVDALAVLDPVDALFLRSISQHTVNPTVIRAGAKTNVVPAEISVDLDGRLLPGLGTADFLAAVRDAVDFPLDLEVLVEGEPMREPVFGPFYDSVVRVLREADPDGVPVPMVTTASTDARLFPRLGITPYGFLPLLLPPGSRHREMLHVPDERVPVEALRFGARCYERLLVSYR
ncbi:M20/M25/M40 family metallo-hydrolase [Actinosynnema sp. NPDC020468]|uniref:M20/M25/M40 family metallo-hydrolase n=1 Tax=Actinosynnema sp. NPDC020468 TaxID=3154488 RepID=UPI0033BFF484